MKKKELIKRLSELVDSHNALQRQLELSQREKEELKAALNLLNAELEAEKKHNEEQRVSLFNSAAEPEEVAEPVTAFTPEPSPSSGFTVNMLEETVEERLSEADTLEEEHPDAESSEEQLPAPADTAFVQPTDITVTAEEASCEEEEIKAEVITPPLVPTAQAPEIIVELPPLVNEITEYGSVVIGKIVCETVKYSGKITASQSENKKELLNLIMGKGEVAKSEIFNITESEVSDETKRELIDAQLDEALDYFKSVVEQI